MKPLTKQTVLTALVFILVIMNLGLMGFMWFNGHRRPPGPENGKFLADELKFDDQQQQQYQVLQHRLADSLNPVRYNERQIHDRFFELMHADNPDSAVVAATIDSMAHCRAQIEYYTFQHFRQVRAICTAQQQKKFDSIIADVMKRMGPKPPPGGKPGPPPPAKN